MGGQTINVVIISSEYEQTEQVQLCKLLPYQEILFYCQQLKSAQSQTSQTEKVKRRQQKSYPTIRNLGLSVIDNSNEINFHQKKKKKRAVRFTQRPGDQIRMSAINQKLRGPWEKSYTTCHGMKK